jgi:hypothetical protein
VREGLRVRELANDEGNRLLRIVRRCSGSVVTWRRAQMVLLSAHSVDQPNDLDRLYGWLGTMIHIAT